MTAFSIELERIVLLGTIVLAVATIAAWALRSRAASVRRAVGCGALFGLLVLPASILLPVQPISLGTGSVGGSLAQVLTADFIPGSHHALRRHSPSTTATPAPPRAPVAQRSLQTGIDPLLGIWAAGVLVLLFGAARDMIALRRFLRLAQPLSEAQLSTRRLLASRKLSGVTLLEHPGVRIPTTAGFLRARMLLPPDYWTKLSDQELDCVLLHELGHARRHDGLVLMLGRIAVALHWFNPLAWLALRRLRGDCEEAADAFALDVGADPRVFAKTLIAVADRACGRVPALAGMLPMAGLHPSRLPRRVASVLRARRPSPRVVPLVSSLLMFVFAAGLGCTKLTSPTSDPNDASQALARLDARLPERIRAFFPAHAPAGMLVGVLLGQDQRVYAFGRRSKSDARPPNADTVFDVGSLSELFTGLAFARMIEQGSVAPNDPVQRYLPNGVRMPLRSGRAITLQDLATHASGLPPLPDNFVEQDPAASRQSYTPAMLYAYLNTATTEPRDGHEVVYSYLGAGLLGHVLALHDKTTYRDLIARLVFGPLGLRSTDFYGSSRRLLPRAVVGHDADGRSVPLRTDTPVLGSCCAIRTTLTDLLTLVRANLHPESTPFAAAIRRMHVPHATYLPGERFAIAWRVEAGGKLLVKRGGGPGFASAVVASPALDEAVIVLANTEAVHAEGVAMEALRALSLARQPLTPSPVVSELPADAVRAESDFSGKIRLLGWRAEPHKLAPGSNAHITFYYRVLAPLGRDYKIFVHAESEGAPRLRADHYPSSGRDSTTAWKTGQIVSDSFEVRVPRDQPAGTLQIWTGFYTASGRLHAARGDGHDRAVGPTFQVQ